MGNFIFGYNQLLTASMLTVSSEDANYPKANMLDLGHLRKHYRSTVITEVTIVIDFSTAKAVKLVFLNDVNFTNVYIQGNTTDTWTSPPFSQQFTISQDKRVQRYKLCAVLTGFNYRYMRIRIPGQTPTDGLSAFRIGTLFVTETTLELSRNPTPPYEYGAPKAKPQIIEFLSGTVEKVGRSDLKIWEGSFGFNSYERDDEDELWTLDAIDEDYYLIFYENLGDNSKGYLCQRDGSVKVSWGNQPNNVDIATLIFREAV
jgi:hypothetical protein